MNIERYEIARRRRTDWTSIMRLSMVKKRRGLTGVGTRLCYTHWVKQKYIKATSINTVSHKIWIFDTILIYIIFVLKRLNSLLINPNAIPTMNGSGTITIKYSFFSTKDKIKTLLSC